MTTNQYNPGRLIPTLRSSRALLAAIAAAVSLAACGGGGGSSGSTTPAISDGAFAGSTVNPLPVGTGVATFSFGATRGEFVKVNGTTGIVSTLSYPCVTDNTGFISADVRPDGVTLGLAGDVYRVDLLTGACVKFATPPGPASTIAVAADSKVYMTSTGVDGNGNFTLYVIDSTGGSIVSMTPMTGANLGFIKGIDFAPDGKLYMSAFDSVLGYNIFEVDTTTGALTAKFGTANLAGDIDIDSNGKLRSAGVTPVIYTINLTSGVVESALALDRQTEKLLVYR